MLVHYLSGPAHNPLKSRVFLISLSHVSLHRPHRGPEMPSGLCHREIFCHEAIDCPPLRNLSTDKQMALPTHCTAYLYYCEPKDGLDVVSLRVMILKPALSLLTLMIL